MDEESEHRRRKRNGVHYTPPELAAFLAQAMVAAWPDTPCRASRHGASGEFAASPIHVLDPACGDGALLRAFAKAVPPDHRKRIVFTGYETDDRAIERAHETLRGCGVARVAIAAGDFLEIEATSQRRALFDFVIANPPYVRTQVLGSGQAQTLAKRFNLTGRVDLYQAFVRAVASVLRPGGMLGLLTSNRFLTVKSGAAVRRLLRTEFTIRAVYDLGDTKLFNAAVLPAIVVATRSDNNAPEDRGALFDRVYEVRNEKGNPPTEPVPDQSRARQEAVLLDADGGFNRCLRGEALIAERTAAMSGTAPSILEALADRQTTGVVRASAGKYRIERGELADVADPHDVWRLSHADSDRWFGIVRSHQDRTFDDVATIRVGIKTTADKVFVRHDWDSLPDDQRPERELLRPLITHRETARWTLVEPKHARRVLYPHVLRNGRREPIRLEDYPRAAGYLRSHEDRLRQRNYVKESGRAWYEIWVPHDPDAWAPPKIVYPDIAESPRFCFDGSGAIVQGDCYWVTLRPGEDPDWFPLILAVANSNFATEFYDVAFHNKLYAGRRRFMTQYVKQFPLPPLGSKIVTEIVGLVNQLVERRVDAREFDPRIDRLVRRAFGLP